MKFILEKVFAHLTDWCACTLSQAGRATLLKSMIQAMSTHLLCVMSLLRCVRFFTLFHLVFFWSHDVNEPPINLHVKGCVLKTRSIYSTKTTFNLLSIIQNTLNYLNIEKSPRKTLSFYKFSMSLTVNMSSNHTILSYTYSSVSSPLHRRTTSIMHSTNEVVLPRHPLPYSFIPIDDTSSIRHQVELQPS